MDTKGVTSGALRHTRSGGSGDGGGGRGRGVEIKDLIINCAEHPRGA